MSTATDVYIVKIATALWQGRAALMVGAGLSREADRTSDSVPKFPLWSELKRNMCTELGYPENDMIGVLDLASQYEALLGRQELEMFLRRQIPDMDFLPSSLHGSMLKLPWADIFTTNYDSLLERADAKYSGSAYDLVQTNEDIAICRKRRRIVKLHGTFSIAGSFVFTEEDYRTYPVMHAPFVNMVQEAMMENVFCLLGFSGTDINFLRWIGWVHDNLGDMMPRIYLCGILNLSEAQRRDLERKNVALVDLSSFASVDEYPDTDDRHKKAIEVFLEELRKRRPISPMDWGCRDFTKNWEILREERQSYPGWLIMPYEIRERHERFLQHYRPIINCNLEKADPWKRLCMAYELNWHIEQQLYDIYPREKEIYLDALLKVNPFPKYLQITEAIHPNENTKDLSMLRESWVGLAFILARWAREHGENDLWKQLMQYLGEVKHLSESWKMQWSYERCKEALFSFDWEAVFDELQEWEVSAQQPYWQLQKAALYAGLDKLDDAESLVLDVLAEVRSRYRNLDKPNIQLQSWEAWGLNLLLFIRDGRPAQGNVEREEMDRWREMITWKENPQAEISYLSSRVLQQKKRIPSNVKRGFDPGEETVEYSFSSVPWWSDSFSWFRIHDLAPLPVRCGMSLLDKQADSAAAEDFWSFRSLYTSSWILQFTHVKDLDSRYTRLAIAIMSDDDVKHLYDACMRSLQQLDTWLVSGRKRAWGSSFAQERLSKDLEIISRLCFRLDDRGLNEVFMLAKRCYNSALYQSNECYAQTLGRLWKRLLISMRPDQLSAHILMLLCLPLLGEGGMVVHVGPHSWPEPFGYLGDIYGCGLRNVKQQEDWKPEIERLTRLVRNNEGELRKRALRRLMPLYFAELLSSAQIEDLGQAIWERLDSYEIPLDIEYSIWGITAWPGADKHDALEKLRKKLLDQDVTDDVQNIDQWYWCNLMYSSKGAQIVENDVEKITWSEEELHKFLGNAIKCMEHLEGEVPELGQHDDFAMSIRTKQKIQLIGRYLLDCVIPFISMTQEEKDSIQGLCQKMEEKDIHLVYVKLAVLLHVEKDYTHAMILLRNYLNSYVEEDVKEAYEGMIHWLNCYEQKIVEEAMPESLLTIAAHNLESRRSPGLLTGLNHMGIIIKEFPENFGEESLEHLCVTLEHLLNESKLYGAFMPGLPDALGIDQAGWPEFQYVSACFAGAIYGYYANEKKEAPPIINKWREMCKISVLPEVWHLAWHEECCDDKNDGVCS